MRDVLGKARGKSNKAAIAVITALLSVLFAILLFPSGAASQRVAVLAPDKTDASRDLAAKLENTLAEKVNIQDDALAEAAFNTAAPENPLNLTKERSKAIGGAIGCEYFILVRGAALRRSSSARPEYYEASAAMFIVSSRTGRLVEWKLLRFEASKPERAVKMLAAAIAPFARNLAADLKDITKAELAEAPPAEMEEPPADATAAAKNFRAPIPYRRVKPKYTSDAYLYDIAATVDIVIDLGASGDILRTEVVRWAGYGLDEAVEETVRGMSWRPAERNGKPLPMRFLVRYNFKKVEKQEDN
jgi:hypothetical protein